MDKDNQILEIFHQNKGYARTKDVLEAGVHHHYLDMLVQKGKVVKIKRGLYRLVSVSVDDELEEVSHIVPDGVVCLFSAWNFYQLSDFVPPEYHIAIEKTHKVALPDYPPIKIYYWSEKYWSIGITEARVGNTIVKIYDKEKSVCDAIRYRNKIGKDVEKEVLKNYLKEKSRNIDKLLRFARLLRVEEQIKTYLSILL
ncbi:MAG: type IV toxin-antitoxin system AbiEi family antitoxin domain-containing protein [Saprospiraceae bacterium]|nr:type IV toxin-antitoxin system AbiEi family antitoxin domain-containing protein [Saprospiraceae bacterium]MCB9037265.1 type IV toxin-antitoxin system AbiEi family antitoxin domain-containing protein [Lewinellaceae bacterium]